MMPAPIHVPRWQFGDCIVNESLGVARNVATHTGAPDRVEFSSIKPVRPEGTVAQD